jgi:peptidoglycan/LPS O-acetylase OafA/YrhL
MAKHRIALLDSFRLLAMISVLLYHFTSPAVHFPNATHHLPVFKYGYLGVYFFFIISGFVISFTLENTPDLSSFYRNRFARLFPPMLLCSLITFSVVSLLDPQFTFANTHQVRNFLPSLTFTNPNLWTQLSGQEFHWLSGSYWTLWTEVQFYLIASATYFLNPKKYVQNLLLTGIAIAFIKHVPIYFLNHYPKNSLHAFFESWRTGDELFNLTFFITWFICGVIFYHLYKGLILKKNILPVIYTLVILFFLVTDMREFFRKVFVDMMIAALLMFALFLLMIYQDKYLFFLKHRLLYRIGMTSYTAYLIHETIGILLINKYSNYLGEFSSLIITIFVLLFAELSYRIYEKPVTELLRKVIRLSNK